VAVELILDSFGLAYVGLSIGMWSSEKLLPTRYLEFIPIVLGIYMYLVAPTPVQETYYAY
jgi:hypothetical protein